jgi:two-component system cell cycle response regulator DivK
MTVLTRHAPITSILDDIACTFIQIHLDDVAKRDLAVWFVEHPRGQYTATELGRALGHDRAAIKTGLRSLSEAAVIAPAGMDIHLPYEDGYAVLAKIRAVRRLKDATIVAVTAEASQEQLAKARAAGFDGFLALPLDPDRFLDTIRRLLKGEPVWEIS